MTTPEERYNELNVVVEEIKQKIVCIYHANCMDGFTAAWLVRQNVGEDVIFHPGVYGENPPNCTGAIVYIVDFSYSVDVMEEIRKEANNLIWIDHHKTAYKDLEFWCFNRPKLVSWFDLNHSGAALTWKYFNQDLSWDEMPTKIKLVEDRDLWKFNYPETRNFCAAVFSYEYTWKNWDKLFGWKFKKEIIAENKEKKSITYHVEKEHNCDLDILTQEGAAVERKHFKDIAELLNNSTTELLIAGHRIIAANLPYTMSSDAGHLLADWEGNDFGCCYTISGNKVIFSLRSNDSKVDVGEVAKKYGGGGHRNAAGFKVSLVTFCTDMLQEVEHLCTWADKENR